MKENYERTLSFILQSEGNKVTNIEGDRGGLTARYGLTLNTMKVFKLDLNNDGVVDEKDVYLVDKAVVDKAFKTYFWDKLKADQLKGGIDLVLCDVAWNSGVGKARQFIAEGFVKDIEKLTERRKRFYTYQATHYSNQKRFLKGWINRANSALSEARKCKI